MHTFITVLSILVSVCVILLAALQISGKYENATDILVPLLGLILLCQAYTQWQSQRKVAYFSIVTAVFIFVCSIVVFFVK